MHTELLVKPGVSDGRTRLLPGLSAKRGRGAGQVVVHRRPCTFCSFVSGVLPSGPMKVLRKRPLLPAMSSSTAGRREHVP